MELIRVATVESSLTDPAAAPKQGDEGAPEATLAFEQGFAPALEGLAPGDERDRADVARPREPRRAAGPPARRRLAPRAGVFATRSADRPNPIGLHRVTILELDGTRMRVSGLEALDGTPVVDVKPALGAVAER